ncbi:hypothetical protein EGR_10480 [Echinococcus granulosus]|uniref:Uncharacterized protein n=1 Tax=Echinococcus granulosus TaxID=6210 RepID=W6U8B5_ECHGR|nr:hypothetical protein EGR_10480 [Echinococcus granulosus]EUB54662.1 hypothetical protein EGR_10480 [Echinococcus granulosus]
MADWEAGSDLEMAMERKAVEVEDEKEPGNEDEPKRQGGVDNELDRGNDDNAQKREK